jgi:hypothetical protein
VPSRHFAELAISLASTRLYLYQVSRAFARVRTHRRGTSRGTLESNMMTEKKRKLEAELEALNCEADRLTRWIASAKTIVLKTDRLLPHQVMDLVQRRERVQEQLDELDRGKA